MDSENNPVKIKKVPGKYKIILEDGSGLLVSPEHKIYGRLINQSQGLARAFSEGPVYRKLINIQPNQNANNLNKSLFENILTFDCSLKPLSSERTLFVSTTTNILHPLDFKNLSDREVSIFVDSSLTSSSVNSLFDKEKLSNLFVLGCRPFWFI